MRKMMDCKRAEGEDYSKYYFSKVTLLEPCTVVPKQAISFIIDGLKDRTIQISARADRYQTTESLYTQFLLLLPLTEKRQKNDAKPNNDRKKDGQSPPQWFRHRRNGSEFA